MSTTDETEDEVEGGTIRPDIRNLLSQIADQVEESKRDHHLDLAIPGTNGLLWARYRPFPVSMTEAKTDQLRKAMARNRPIMLQAACDTLIDACEQLMVLPPQFDGEIGEEGENLVSIDDMVPVRYEQRAAELFIKDKEVLAYCKSARAVVLSLFPTEQAIIAQNVEVSTWMQDVSAKVNSEMVGE